MVPPSGSLTFKPSTVGLLSMHSLWICKKCPVVPESAIANIFVFTADAYVAIFCIGSDGVFFFDFVSSYLFSLFVVMSNSTFFCLVDLHKLI